ncbi:MAG: hypothetical protein IJG40_11805 [Oscillospiraceae bacterium]|nr:hypothetical protein [Oscillospiraceae bacterium]
MECYKIALSAGDSVGTELIAQAKKLIAALEAVEDVQFQLFEFESCNPAIERYGTAFRDEDLKEAKTCCGILFGNLGISSSQPLKPEQSPVYTLTAARNAFHVCTNIRPVRIQKEYESLSPLKQKITEKGIDILIVRDLMGGMITGARHHREGIYGREASDLEYYNEQIVRHSAEFAFQSAEFRHRKVTSVDKANILSSSKLWRETVKETGKRYPQIMLENDYVDHTAMQLLTAPWEYDVILTSNVFGDILADEIAQISGAPWLFGSGEIAMDGRGIYTPNQLHHPQGDQLAGKGIVSPYGILNALSLLIRYSCNRGDLAERINRALERAIGERLFTAEAVPEGGNVVSTKDLGDIITAYIVGKG